MKFYKNPVVIAGAVGAWGMIGLFYIMLSLSPLSVFEFILTIRTPLFIMGGILCVSGALIFNHVFERSTLVASEKKP